jgi:SAM-dependent methyltransferase
MRPRVTLARFLIRLGGFIQSLAIMVMKPNDLSDFSRGGYAERSAVSALSREHLILQGLDPFEMSLLDKIPIKSGRLLLLGLGGGRDAIRLSELGFEVTGVDFVPEMIVEAQRNASLRGLCIDTLHQEISNLEVPSDSYDLVWLAAAMYSNLPKKGRAKLLKNVWKSLKSGGYVVLQYLSGTPGASSCLPDLLRKVVALITWGNIDYEKGDMLWGNAIFVHLFGNEDEIRSEIAGTGFDIVFSAFTKENSQGGAILKKPSAADIERTI